MRRVAAALTVLALAGCATPPPRDAIRAYASPSDLVAAEAAFNRLAQEKGQWTAFRETATADAVMFVPALGNAQAWLKGRKDPPKAVIWQPHRVIMSCDGTLGFTAGAAQWPGGAHGRFVTIWQRQPNVAASAPILRQWKWVLDTGERVSAPLTAPDKIETRIASCKGKAHAFPAIVSEATAHAGGASADNSLEWSAAGFAGGSYSIRIYLWDGEKKILAVDDRFSER